MTQAIPNCCAKILKSYSSFLFCEASRFQSCEQKLIMTKNLKKDKNAHMLNKKNLNT